MPGMEEFDYDSRERLVRLEVNHEHLLQRIDSNRADIKREIQELKDLVKSISERIKDFDEYVVGARWLRWGLLGLAGAIGFLIANLKWLLGLMPHGP